MRYVFAVIFILDLILILASYATDQSWGFAVCSNVLDLCDYSLTLKVIGVLSFGMMILVGGY